MFPIQKELNKPQPMWYKILNLGINALIVIIGSVLIKGFEDFKVDNNNRSFTNAETRLLTEQFMKRLSEDSSAEYKWFNHVTDPDLHMPKKDKDSIYITRKEWELSKRRDVLNDFDALNRTLKIENNQSNLRAEIKQIRDDQRLILNILQSLTK